MDLSEVEGLSEITEDWGIMIGEQDTWNWNDGGNTIVGNDKVKGMAMGVSGHSAIKDQIAGEEAEEQGGMRRTVFVDTEITKN